VEKSSDQSAAGDGAMPTMSLQGGRRVLLVVPGLAGHLAKLDWIRSIRPSIIVGIRSLEKSCLVTLFGRCVSRCVPLPLPASARVRWMSRRFTVLDKFAISKAA
jgi:hypothetical protein